MCPEVSPGCLLQLLCDGRESSISLKESERNATFMTSHAFNNFFCLCTAQHYNLMPNFKDASAEIWIGEIAKPMAPEGSMCKLSEDLFIFYCFKPESIDKVSTWCKFPDSKDFLLTRASEVT